MKRAVTHDLREEEIEAKVHWFKSLTLAERMDMLCSFTELALDCNPELAEKKDAQPVKGRIQVIPRA